MLTDMGTIIIWKGAFYHSTPAYAPRLPEPGAYAGGIMKSLKGAMRRCCAYKTSLEIFEAERAQNSPV